GCSLLRLPGDDDRHPVCGGLAVAVTEVDEVSAGQTADLSQVPHHGACPQGGQFERLGAARVMCRVRSAVYHDGEFDPHQLSSNFIQRIVCVRPNLVLTWFEEQATGDAEDDTPLLQRHGEQPGLD